MSRSSRYKSPNGYVFLTNHDEDWTRFYQFSNPSDVDEWKDFDFNFVEEHPYMPAKILDFVTTLKESGSESIILSCNIKKDFDSREAIDFVLMCKVYYKLLKDFMF